jgi:hypothetical protein
MSSLTNINNNTRVVNVGRTTPIAPGQQPASKSIPVVLASDQTAIPVVEQNKVQSEVSLSLLGIPRSEVALGIFADVNTYDVNPSEWSSFPQYYSTDIDKEQGYGIKHLPNEAGALVESPRDKKAILTSKRFFRYQPGRVSAATFGVKCSVSDSDFARNPVIRKYGIFDNFDGYYWETKQSGKKDNFSVVRRTQSLLKFPSSPFGLTTENLRKSNGGDEAIPYEQTDDYRVVGKEGKALKGKYFARERTLITENIIEIAKDAFTAATTNGGSFQAYWSALTTAQQEVYRSKCHRDVKFWVEFMVKDLEWGSNAHTRVNTKNYTTAVLDDAENEKELYEEVRTELGTLVGTSNAIWTTVDIGLNALASIPVTFFGDVYNAGGSKVEPVNLYGTAPYAGSGGTITFGDRNKFDVLFDVRKHYYSYFVSTFDHNGGSGYNNVADKSLYQTYTFSDQNLNANFIPDDVDLTRLVGLVLSPTSVALSAGQYYPYAENASVTNAATTSTFQLTAIEANVLNEFYDNIRYKCARDMEYIIQGYQNDIIGNGNAETLYNASMYYKGSGLSIFTQADGSGVPDEISKHLHLKEWIKEDLTDPLFFGFGLSDSSSTVGTLEDLHTVLANNFTRETKQGVNLGDRGFAGNLVVFRDGLLMTHAAINDPNMLKEVEQVKAYVSVPSNDSNPTIFQLTKGGVTFGQKVRVVTSSSTADISDAASFTPASTGAVVNKQQQSYGKIYNVSRVYGPTGSEFSLQDQDGNPVYAYRGGNFIDNAEEILIETVVPFIGDVIYNADHYRQPVIDRDLNRTVFTIQNYDGTQSAQLYQANNDPFPTGMQWPYRYSSSGILNDGTATYIGHIDTSLSPTNSEQITKIRQQYDTLNFVPEYINWIKNNVKPEYWGVYEYRVPRSRFSHDKLDGNTSKRVYSDLATGPTGIVRPGMEVLDDDGIWKDAVSEYDFDFTKVTMLKIEFSWYGAVGALFLAYVPIGNGEARWVRVHHLRASNQLKIASLGNATLPITYNVWGGGSPDTLGDGETATHTYGTSQSHHIVKYGASYYIDGGDRGTVRLYSHNNNDTVPAYGKQWVIHASAQIGSNAQYTVTSTETDDSVNPRPLPMTTLGGNTRTLEYFMGAQLKTNNPVDTGIKVVWVDGDTLYFSKAPQGSGITLIPDRADLVYGLETKDFIFSTVEGNPVRNRVQVYPTKMSSANLGSSPVRLRMKRTPVFQSLTIPGASVTLTLNAEYSVSPSNLPLSVTETGGGALTYLLNGESIFGWFQGLVGAVDNETIFGRLYKISGQYYFEVLQSFNDTITLNNGGEFLPDPRYTKDSDGDVYLAGNNDTANEVPLADTLTSINVINNSVVPIPNTGANVATLYLTPGGTEQVDLDTYFDYNKEYLSYPLTDEPETLYFAVDSDQSAKEDGNDIAIGLTWEEQ